VRRAPLTVRAAGLLGLAWTLSAAPAAAEIPLPSYRDRLAVEAWHAVNGHIAEAGRIRLDIDPSDPPAEQREVRRQAEAQLRLAIAGADAFAKQVTPTSGLAYLTGLAWRLLGDDTRAEAAYRRSIELDPNGATDAWYDLGEVLITREDWAGADHAFKQVSAGLTTGPEAWRGPIRRAEIAAWQGDPEAFEAHVEEALRRGFRMDQIRMQPQWRTFYADERLKETIEKLVQVYGSRDLLLDLGAPAP
jgi:tetratricopeptide (TPR) repeat protein